jgi:hypothetical protein
MRSGTPTTHEAQITLVGCATIGFFMLSFARAYFIPHIARSNDKEHMFYVMLQEK